MKYILYYWFSPNSGKMCKRPYHKGVSLVNTHVMHAATKYSLTGIMKLFHIQRHSKEIIFSLGK